MEDTQKELKKVVEKQRVTKFAIPKEPIAYMAGCIGTKSKKLVAWTEYRKVFAFNLVDALISIPLSLRPLSFWHLTLNY